MEKNKTTQYFKDALLAAAAYSETVGRCSET